MSYGSSTIIKCVRRPDATIGIIQVVAIGIEITFLPSEMALQYGPHLHHVSPVAVVLEMPKQLVDIVQVHIIVVHLVIAFRIATDIAVRVHLCAPLFSGTSQVLFLVLCRMNLCGGHLSDLTLGISIKMTPGPVSPAQHVAQITSTPACQRHAPANATVQPGFSIPVAVSSHHQGTTQRINVRIGSVKDYASCQFLHSFLGFLKAVSAPRIHQQRQRVATHKPFFIQGGSQILYGSFAVSLENILVICPQVTIATQFGLTNVADYNIHFHFTFKACSLKSPQCLLRSQRGYHFQTEYCLSPPRLVTHHIAAHSILVACLTIVRLVQFHAIESELHVSTIFLLVDGKHRTVTRFHTPLRRATIERTGKAVLSVDTHESPAVRAILLLLGRHGQKQQQSKHSSNSSQHACKNTHFC